MKKKIIIFVSFILTYFLFTSGVSSASVTPTLVPGNPDCAYYGLVEVNGNYTPGAFSGAIASWSTTTSVDKVIVKGGPNANVYTYSPEATSDTTLITPTNPSNGKPYGLSHINFCADFELEVTKTADTAFDRDWDWDITKTGDVSQLNLTTNQIYTVNYEVTVSADNTDSNYTVAGSIMVHNPAPVSATVTGVSDTLAGVGSLTVNCPVSFPYVLGAGQTLVCTYSTSVPDATTRLNTATATTTGVIGGDTGTALADFANASIDETDECVDVTDDQVGFLGQFCATTGDKSYTFTYTKDLSYRVCGIYNYENTASFVTNDTAATDSDSWIVNVNIPCPTSCTLTQGYWKTHSSYGPAKKYDPTWALITPLGENSTFYSSGKTYFQVLWTAPGGNAYYNLAHQFIAAKLNHLDGATLPPAVAGAMTQAHNLFNAYTPAQIGALKGNNATRQQFISLAGILGNYNEGNAGIPHCSE